MNINENPSSRSSLSWDQNELRLLSHWSRTRELPPDPLHDGTSTDDLREEVKTEIRQNHQFTLFCILPSLSPLVRDVHRASAKLNISDERALHFTSRLLRTGLWTLEDGKIRTHFDYLDLGDISVKDYLSLTISIVSQISEEKGFFYETLSTVTNRHLIRGFKSKVNQALREFHENSAVAEEKNCVFSWTHTGLIELEMKNMKKREEEI